jgi:predicted DCC family thiol-disulfide oxidoreductase YuxK
VRDSFRPLPGALAIEPQQHNRQPICLAYMKTETTHPILLFDGVCNLCNASVQFVLKRDTAGQFRFASLQSEAGQQLLGQFAKAPADFSTVVLIEKGQLFTKSDAALRVARRLPGLWPALYGFIFLPRFLRNGVYDWIARNRYRWFGKQEQCMLPRPEWKERFLG